MKPLISIIVPVYNTEKFLPNCLESILKQTYTNIEVIIIDDGSTDSSGIICDQYAEQDNRVKVYHGKNGGLLAARKKAVAYCKGEYIGFVDSDDWVEDVMYEKLAGLLQDNAADMICSGAYLVSADRKSDCLNLLEEGEYTGEQLCSLYKVMMYDMERNKPGVFQSIWSKLLKRSLLEQCILDVDDRITYGEDAAIGYNCCLHARKIIISNYQGYYYRANDSSMCGKGSIDIFERTYIFYNYMRCVFAGYPQDWNLEKQLKCYVLLIVKIGLGTMFNIRCKTIYYLSYDKIQNCKRIILYGAGSVGQAYYNQIKKQNKYEVICWVDQKCAGQMIQDQVISPVDKIKYEEFDKIVIAIKNEKVMKDIKKQLTILGVDNEKIVWIPPVEEALQWQLEV